MRRFDEDALMEIRGGGQGCMAAPLLLPEATRILRIIFSA
jgi:hypothetical protein